MARDFFDHTDRALPSHEFGDRFPEQEFSTTSILKQAADEKPAVHEDEVHSAMDLSVFDL